MTPEVTLLNMLREKLGHTEVKGGCGKGDRGACAVLLNGKAVNACLTLALRAKYNKMLHRPVAYGFILE